MHHVQTLQVLTGLAVAIMFSAQTTCAQAPSQSGGSFLIHLCIWLLGCYCCNIWGLVVNTSNFKLHNFSCWILWDIASYGLYLLVSRIIIQIEMQKFNGVKVKIMVLL